MCKKRTHPLGRLFLKVSQGLFLQKKKLTKQNKINANNSFSRLQHLHSPKVKIVAIRGKRCEINFMAFIVIQDPIKAPIK